MSDIQLTKIILLRGHSADLPHDLDPAELAFSTDEGRLFIGCDPTSGQPQYQRADFPYRNIEVLTENSTDLFASMHGERMKNGGGDDYYTSQLTADRVVWTSVQIEQDSELVDYRIADISSVAAWIDYAVTESGSPVRMGVMNLTHYADFEGEPYLVDNGSARRDPTLTSPSNYDAAQTVVTVAFRFMVDGPLNAPYLTFQYKNFSTNMLNLRFKVSRPEAVFYDQPSQPIV